MGIFGGKTSGDKPDEVEVAAPIATDRKPSHGEHEFDLSTWVYENAGPISGQMTMGGVFGYCSGYALQKAGK
eukprot:scaffold207706_cov28-Prasinocladus_malaysianus.AAC.2